MPPCSQKIHSNLYMVRSFVQGAFGSGCTALLTGRVLGAVKVCGLAMVVRILLGLLGCTSIRFFAPQYFLTVELVNALSWCSMPHLSAGFNCDRQELQ